LVLKQGRDIYHLVPNQYIQNMDLHLRLMMVWI